MLASIITGPDLFSAKRQIKNSSNADLIELRLDYLDSIAIDKVKKLMVYSGKKVIFNLTTAENGGKYSQNEKKMLYDLENLFSLKPAYFDLASNISFDFVQRMHEKYPEVEIITSYHNLKFTEDNLEQLFEKIKNPYAKFYKIVCYANSTIDALRMIDFLKKNKTDNLIAFSLGERGSFSRVISQIFNSRIVYGFVDKKINEGQISIDDLVNIYNIKNINEKTDIYALLADPIEPSLSHVYHNSIFKEQNKNSVYVKIKLNVQEMNLFFNLVKDLPFSGFSVSMPLKEKAIHFLDENNSPFDAVNTILVKDRKLIGYNTDGIAALDAVERKMKVKDKKVVILGAGGSAKAIAYEAKKRGAEVVIINRDETKAIGLASKLKCRAFPLSKIREVLFEGYNILINATSSSMANISLVPIECFISGTIVMDIVTRPVDTILLKEANIKGCVVLYGMEMFINQAALQFN